MDQKLVIKVENTKCKVVSKGHQIDFENDYYLQSNGSFAVLEHLDYSLILNYNLIKIEEKG